MQKKSLGLFEDFKHSIIYFIKGGLIGIANIIPGVSGGTFALILGIYERLLLALHAIDLKALKTIINLFSKRFSKDARSDFMHLLIRLDAWFLGLLGVGGMVVILASSFLIDWLLVNYPAYTLSFFIGLIIPSIAVPWQMMGKNRTVGSLLWITPGCALTIMISLAFGRFVGTGDNLLWGFLTGMIAISAMILPGISGSFVMLVMGQYQNVLNKLQSVQMSLVNKQIDWMAWIWLAVFALGCIAGLLLFARFLNFLLKKYRVATLAFLIGLILGSFYVLWPFKDYDAATQTSMKNEFVESIVEEKQDIRVATSPNILPNSFSEILMNGGFLLIGLIGAFGMNRFGSDESNP